MLIQMIYLSEIYNTLLNLLYFELVLLLLLLLHVGTCYIVYWYSGIYYTKTR